MKKRYDRFTLRKMAKEVSRLKKLREDMQAQRDDYQKTYAESCGTYMEALEDFVNHFLEGEDKL